MLKGDARSCGKDLATVGSLRELLDHVAARVGRLAFDATIAQRYVEAPLSASPARIVTAKPEKLATISGTER